VPEIAAALLSPTVPSAPTRDPFRSATTVEADPDQLCAGTVAGTEESASELDPDDRETEASIHEGSEAGKDAPLPDLELNATYIRSDYRAAVINGQLYALGDALPAPNSTVPPFVVAEIHRHKVLLESRTQSLELEYSFAEPGRAQRKSTAQSTAAPKPVRLPVVNSGGSRTRPQTPARTAPNPPTPASDPK
jgi:hypothetical protein